MLKVVSYSAKGVKGKEISLPGEWEAKSNPSLLAQAIRVYTDRSHIGFAKAQTRAEVNRTTKKLYKQKGTGGARHGSRKAPIFVGGGVAHGPRPVKRELTLPLNMRRKAIAVAMTSAVKDGKVVAASMDFTKTKEAQSFINKALEKGKTLFVVSKDNLKVVKFIKNIKDVKVVVFPGLNAFDIFFSRNLVFDIDIFKKEKKEKETK